MPAQIVEGEFAQFDRTRLSDHANVAALDIVEAQQKIGERRFARAGVADDGDGLAGLDAETDVAQDPVLSLYANQT